jgi:hypothetical protein
MYKCQEKLSFWGHARFAQFLHENVRGQPFGIRFELFRLFQGRLDLAKGPPLDERDTAQGFFPLHEFAQQASGRGLTVKFVTASPDLSGLPG